MNSSKWVLVDLTKGAKTSDKSQLSPAALRAMAEAVQKQVNEQFAAEWGSQVAIRVAATSTDIKKDEWAYGFLDKLPDAPGASAYHDITKAGVPFSLCAVSTCGSLFGPSGVSVDVSHEILETLGDEGANQFANDNAGSLHAVEMCDAVEVQTYGITCADGTVVQVSNWLLRSWFIPGAPGPYDYMSRQHLPGAVAPPGPLQTAKGAGGNYQIVSKWGGDRQVTAKQTLIDGTRRKGMIPNWSSRAAKRLKEAEMLESGDK